MGAFSNTAFAITAFDVDAFDLAAVIVVPVTANYFFSADKQTEFTSNIDSVVLSANITTQYTSNLGG